MAKPTIGLVNPAKVAGAPVEEATVSKNKALPKLPPLKRTRKPKPPKPCGCGCGAMTKGGNFIAGHDARLHGWALRIQRELVTYKDIEAADGPGVVKAVKAYLAAAADKA